MPTWSDYWLHGDKIGPGDDLYTCLSALSMALQERDAAVNWGAGYRDYLYDNTNLYVHRIKGETVYQSTTQCSVGGPHPIDCVKNMISVIKKLIDTRYIDETIGPAFYDYDNSEDGAVQTWDPIVNAKTLWYYPHGTLETWCANHKIPMVDYENEYMSPRLLEWLRQVIVSLRVAYETSVLVYTRGYYDNTKNTVDPWSITYKYNVALKQKWKEYGSWSIETKSYTERDKYVGLALTSFTTNNDPNQVGWEFQAVRLKIMIDPDRFPGVDPSGKVSVPIYVPNLSKLFARYHAKEDAARKYYSNGLRFAQGDKVIWKPKFTLTRSGMWDSLFTKENLRYDDERLKRPIWVSEMIFNDYPPPQDWVGQYSPDYCFWPDAGPYNQIQVHPPFFDFKELGAFKFN